MADIIEALQAVLQDRKRNPVEGSYTTSLFSDGADEITKKVGEEAVEVVLAAARQGDERLIEETADLVYHLLVLLVSHDLEWADVEAELARRRRPAA